MTQVVLLEDVDALLEERQLTDFKRSALVSGKSREGVVCVEDAYRVLVNIYRSSVLTPSRVLQRYELTPRAYPSSAIPAVMPSQPLNTINTPSFSRTTHLLTAPVVAGILLLTTTRLHALDPSLRSRIALAVHFEKLRAPQRRQLWRRFFAELRLGASVAGEKATSTAPAAVDYEDLVAHVPELAREELNGRQMRNLLAAARGVARVEGARLAYRHLAQVLRVGARFDKYLRKEERKRFVPWHGRRESEFRY